MQALRVSATDIDAVRRFYDEEDADLADLIRQLRHLMPSTDAMEAGTALHKALEYAEPGDHSGFVTPDGFTFSFETEAEIDLPAIREMKATREYIVDDVRVTLVGKVDALHGKRIDDHKFTARFDADRYLDSYQWRIYLEIFGADHFRWNIFEALESAPRNYLIRNVHALDMHRYPGIGEDVEREVRAFVTFAKDHLPERFMPAERVAA